MYLMEKSLGSLGNSFGIVQSGIRDSTNLEVGVYVVKKMRS